MEGQTVTREKVSTSVDLPLSSECKRILAYAAEEADKLFAQVYRYLLLGVLREQDCFAANLLRERGIGLQMACERIGSTSPEPLGRTPKSPGLPSGYTSHRLLYNNAAEILILELRASSAYLLPTRLFTRHKDKEAYEQIGSPAEDVSYESPVTCENLPVVVFNSLKRGKTGGNWEGLYLFNLNTRELEVSISPEKLQLSDAHPRLCIPELVSLSEDARVLFVNIGVEKVASAGSIVHHYLAKVDVPGQRVTLLSRLLGTRF